jgi:ribosomal protein L37AE/L43A
MSFTAAAVTLSVGTPHRLYKKINTQNFNSTIRKNKEKDLENKNKIEIVCSKCSKDNTVKLSDKLHCKHCEEEITSKKYIKKPWILIPTTIAVFSGIAGGVYIDESIETDRYPMAVEHSLLESCISLDERPLRPVNIEKKKEICVRALEKTIKEVEYSVYEDNVNLFMRSFGKHANDCM